MRVLVSLLAVLGLLFLAWFGVGLLGLNAIFGIVLPYLAIVIFLGGFLYRVLAWARVPVPFRIPTTCGQQKSLSWIRHNELENPSGTLGVIGRMALEVLLFRSLARNTRAEVRAGGKVVHASDKLLWIAALAFHYTFLIVLVRHLRFFSEPVPGCVHVLATLDGFLQIGLPEIQLSGLILLAALLFLLVRRLYDRQLRYISLPADYFPLFLLLAIVGSGLTVRHFARADIVAVKEMAMGLVSLHPVSGAGVHWLVFAHLFFVSVLLAYFPFSKLMHMGGVFLSPTRNLANSNRRVRHINPWNPTVKVHTYAEYEDEFREKMKAAGIPVEKE